MNMLSAQCAELRDKAKLLMEHADGLKAPYVIPSTKELMALTMLDSATRMDEAAETIHAQQAHIDRLLALNGELCAEVNAKAARIRELELLVRDVYDAWCFECNPWADDFACAWFDGSECSIRRRMTELGLDVDA